MYGQAVRMKAYGLIFLCCLLFGCNNKAAISQELTIKITFRLIDDDRIKLYYIPEHNNTYDEENMIETKITGSIEMQSIDVVLNEIPKKFRIDLGESKHETIISIASVLIGTKSDTIEVNKKTIHRFFSPNIYTILVKNGFRRIKIKNRYDPFLESTALLHKKIELELL
jgi:hypothetical protein